jgi:glycosyltransferase involved in cell wall biosynthesis
VDAILTNYPLSAAYHKRLVDVIGGEVEVINFFELRQLPLLDLFRRVRTLRFERFFLPMEDPEAGALLPVFFLLAHLTKSRKVIEVSPDMVMRQVSKLETAVLGLRTAAASLGARRALYKTRRELKALSQRSRIEIERPAKHRGLFLNANLWFGVKAGGSVGHISGVVNSLDDIGHHMRFATAGGRLLVRDRVPMLELKPPRIFGFPWEANYYGFHFQVVKQVLSDSERYPFDFIYQRMSVANFSGVTISRKLEVPLILEYNGSEAWVARNWGRPLRYQKLAEQVEELTIKHAHLIVTISDVLKDELLERGVPSERIAVYPNCIDPETFDADALSASEIRALKNKLRIPEDAIVVAFVGTFGQWHGAHVLAEAAQLLLETDPEWVQEHKVHFLFVGDGAKMRDVRERLGEHLGGPHITLSGLIPQDQAPLYLAASDILSSPHVPNSDGSRFFGSPTKLFEYMAMGKAIIASDLDQIGSVLSGSLSVKKLPKGRKPSGSNEPAILTEPGSASDIVTALKFLVARPDWRTALGRNARELAMSKYTWRHHVAAILERAQALNLVEPSDQ